MTLKHIIVKMIFTYINDQT